jgi:hypothetical protein
MGGYETIVRLLIQSSSWMLLNGRRFVMSSRTTGMSRSSLSEPGRPIAADSLTILLKDSRQKLLGHFRGLFCSSLPHPSQRQWLQGRSLKQTRNQCQDLRVGTKGLFPKVGTYTQSAKLFRQHEQAGGLTGSYSKSGFTSRAASISANVFTRENSPAIFDGVSW